MPSGGKSDTKPSSSNLKIKALESKRKSLFALVQHLFELSKTVAEEEDRRLFLVRTQTLQQTRTDYVENLDKLIAARLELNPEVSPSYDNLELLDELICQIMFARENLLASERCGRELRANNHRTTPKLPPIELIKFYGDPAKFPIFAQIFKRVVDSNPELTDDEKVHYLVTHLSGAASNSISGVSPSGENYRLIWNLLTAKYEDVRCLANSYLSKILKFKNISTHDTKNLNRFSDEFESSVAALRAMNLPDLPDFLFTHLALSKLDSTTVQRFEQSHDADLPRFKDLADFVRKQTKILSRSEALNKSSPPANELSSRAGKAHGLIASAQSASESCELCHSNHRLFHCRDFIAMRVCERSRIVKRFKLCMNCLGKHSMSVCPSKGRCFKCRGTHHTSLHVPSKEGSGRRESGRNSAAASSVEPSPPPPANVGACASCATSEREGASPPCSSFALSPTALVILGGPRRANTSFMRVLLDTGANNNFITQDCCTRNSLRINYKPSVAHGLGNTTQPVLGFTTVTITSRYDSRFTYCFRALVVKQLIGNLPANSIDYGLQDVICALPLADETCLSSAPIECILGAALLPKILGNRKTRLARTNLFAFESTLGNLVMGEVDIPNQPPLAFCACTNRDGELEQLVQAFWNLDSVPHKKHLSPEEVACERDFEKNVSRLEDGSFLVSLPFREDPSSLGNSRNGAERRLLSLEKRLDADLDVRAGYNATFQEYLEKGYMHKIDEPFCSDLSYYIPHRAVYRPDKTTSKIRLVLDASSKTSSGKSLNDVLHCGPNIQSNIFNLLLNFRLYQVALSADIEKMYFSIKVHPSHRRFLRVLFRFDRNDPISTYEFSSLPMGLSSACYLAVRVLKRLCRDEGNPDLRSLLESSTCTYMDDYLLSVQTSEEAVLVKRRLTELHARAGFRLAKWLSNSAQVMNDCSHLDRESHLVTLDADPHAKLVGLWWDPALDSFLFKASAAVDRAVCTKRHMLSVTAALYDPLGFLAPVTSGLKRLIQECWKRGLSWDQPVPTDIASAWDEVYRDLPLISHLRIPRHLGLADGVKVTLLGFSDASESCMGAVIYARIGDLTEDAQSVAFVCAKSRVAPLKRVTLARLELCAAYTLSLLTQAVLDEIGKRCAAIESLAFSDSTVALSWICSSPHRWHTFVANRTSAIQDIISPGQWFHVPGASNPSDVITRPVSPQRLLESRFWLAGPEWISLPLARWPATRFSRDLSDEGLPEERDVGLVSVADAASHPLDELVERVSSWSKLLRILVFVMRFMKKLTSTGTVLPNDLAAAEALILRRVQQIHFADDLEALAKGKICNTPLRKLTPFLSDGLLLVGGRLKHSELTFRQKHPVLLPSKNRVTELIVRHHHVINFHTGPGLLLAILRREYWILSARGLVRGIVHACNTCFRTRPVPTVPLMGNLPELRFKEVKSFINTGVDYAGPILIRTHRGKNAKTLKAYICLFVCLATKAVHIELVSDLSTDLFLSAFKRFIARRGPVSVILSDGGRNFIGAKRKLSEIFTLVTSSDFNREMIQELAPKKIEFKINPPLSPHHGGIWEANVKSVKSHLFRVLGNQVLSYEEFNTLLIQIEAILNSRPLCTLSSDPNEPGALTPSHFLTLQPLRNFPADELRDVPVERVQRFALVDKLVQSYWDRWRIEYLSSLQVREKWNVPDRPLELGQVVLLKEPNAPTLCWPLGVIVEIFPGSDGVTRVARIKTRAGSYVRSATRICPLPTQ